jgi:hypothetical protein
MAMETTPSYPIAAPVPYPVTLTVDYAERQSRWKAVFRLPLAIPLILFVALLDFALYNVIWLLWIVILLRGRIPRWLFDFIVGVNRALARASAYFGLLTDQYPPFDGDHPLRLDVRYPERTSRLQLVVWKLIASVPHLIVIEVLQSVSLAVLPVAWIAIILSGRYPKGLHDLATGVLRWQQRVKAYLFSLTDEFPPYSLSADAGRGSRRAMFLSAAPGALLLAGGIAGITALVIYAGGHNEQHISVSYERLVNGQLAFGETGVIGDSVGVSLNGAKDPGDPAVPFLAVTSGKHFVTFDLQVRDTKSRNLWVSDWDFWLDDSLGKEHSVFLVLVNKRPLPLQLTNGEVGNIQLVFEIADTATPKALHYQVERRLLKTLVYQFR